TPHAPTLCCMKVLRIWRPTASSDATSYGLPSYQTVTEPWHNRAVTRPRIAHLRANLFNARSLTRSTVRTRQCHALLVRVTDALYWALGVGSAVFWYASVTRGARF